MRFGTSWKCLNKYGMRTVVTIELLLVFLHLVLTGLRLRLDFSTVSVCDCFLLNIVVIRVSLQVLFCVLILLSFILILFLY